MRVKSRPRILTRPSLNDLRQGERRMRNMTADVKRVESPSPLPKPEPSIINQSTGYQLIKLGCAMWDFVHAELIACQWEYFWSPAAPGRHRRCPGLDNPFDDNDEA